MSEYTHEHLDSLYEAATLGEVCLPGDTHDLVNEIRRLRAELAAFRETITLAAATIENLRAKCQEAREIEAAVERLRPYEAELTAAAAALQRVWTLGEVKSVGLREVAEVAAEVAGELERLRAVEQQSAEAREIADAVERLSVLGVCVSQCVCEHHAEGQPMTRETTYNVKDKWGAVPVGQGPTLLAALRAAVAAKVGKEASE